MIGSNQQRMACIWLGLPSWLHDLVTTWRHTPKDNKALHISKVPLSDHPKNIRTKSSMTLLTMIVLSFSLWGSTAFSTECNELAHKLKTLLLTPQSHHFVDTCLLHHTKWTFPFNLHFKSFNILTARTSHTTL